MSTVETSNEGTLFETDEINIMVATALKSALTTNDGHLENAVSAMSKGVQSHYRRLIAFQKANAFKTGRKIDDCTQYDPNAQTQTIPDECKVAAKYLRSLSLTWKNEVHITHTLEDNLPWLSGGIVRVTAELRNGTDNQTAIDFISNAFNTKVIGNMESSNHKVAFDTVPFPKQPNSPDLTIQDRTL